ncbi:MAG: hypothetical protein ACI9S8_000351 [Chlamydiales bacterium]|jgi:uncharacterized protein (TIGR00730 family)
MDRITMNRNGLDKSGKHTDTFDSWRVFRIISEFVEGFETMTDIGPSASIFGSARTKPGSEYYELACNVAKAIVAKKIAVITGGGPGIMEAANKGAQEAKGKSCGLSIDLPFESESNAYIDNKFNLNFRYFFIRKVMFVRYAQAFVVLPGGFGTLDELFEALTLIQTQKISAFPIYLMGSKYWEGLINWLKESAADGGTISAKDLDLITITDDPNEVADGIERHFKEVHTTYNF